MVLVILDSKRDGYYRKLINGAHEIDSYVNETRMEVECYNVERLERYNWTCSHYRLLLLLIYIYIYNRVEFYLVLWKDYSKKEASWVPS